MMSERTQNQLKRNKPVAMPIPSGMLQRNCACGNHVIAGGECVECAKKKTGLQRQLTIGASNDSWEQEADRVAEQLLALAAPLNSAVKTASPRRIQRFNGQSTEDANRVPVSVDRVLASSGRPLDSVLRQDMEQRFGHDFSQVRVHIDTAAGQSARDVNANAYTVGHNMVFGAGRFAPGTREGRRLITHELTHVVQQSGSDGIYADKRNEQHGVLSISREIGDIARHSLLQRAPDRAGVAGVGEKTVRHGSTLPYREAKELAECIRIMGESNADYCREEMLHEQDTSSTAPVSSSPFPPVSSSPVGASAGGKTARIKSLDQTRNCAFTVVYSNAREVDCDTVFKNLNGRNPPEPLCGASLVYDITSVSATGSKCPKLDGLKVSEKIKGDQGCTPPGFVWPAPNPCVIGVGGKISGCTDTFTVCGPTKNHQGNGCTENVDQEIEVGGQLAEEHEIVFDLKKNDKSCTGKVTRN